MSESRIDVAVELALSGGLVVSGASLLLGLLLSEETLLRWGIVALIATPAGGTAILAAGLLLKRDWVFAGVCLWVLFVLFSSLMVALRS